MIFISSVGFGTSLCVSYKRELRNMQTIALFLEHIRYELESRLTPLPLLFLHASEQCEGYFKNVIKTFIEELEEQIYPDPECCMHSAVCKCKFLSPSVTDYMTQLVSVLQCVDYDGQIAGIDRLRKQCQREIESIEIRKSDKLKNYRTITFCAGAAIAIILI